MVGLCVVWLFGGRYVFCLLLWGVVCCVDGFGLVGSVGVGGVVVCGLEELLLL